MSHVTLNSRRSHSYIFPSLLLMIVAGDVKAADWMMVVTEPGKAAVVKHIFYNGSGIECRTDRWGQIYMLPSGTRIDCLRLPALRLAIQPPVISNTKE